MQRSLFIFILALCTPIVVGAQSFTPSTPGAATTSFQGMSFSGVGGAILNCTNIGSSISSMASDLFGNSGPNPAAVGQQALYAIPGASQMVPVKDSEAKKLAEKQAKKTNCLDGIAYAVAKNALQKVSDKTLNWVNTGFSGNPLYVRDMDSYLKSINDEKIQSFLARVPNNNSIFGNAIRSTITSQVTGFDDGRVGQVMNTPEGQKYEKFQKDFTNGGWDSFLDFRNNPLGAYFSASEQVSREISDAQENIKSELVQGNGFLSMKKCAEYEDIRFTSATTANGVPVDEQLPGTVSGPITPAAPAGAPKCIRYETVTPGAIIAQQTSYVTNSAVRQLEQADKINEVLGSFFDQLINRLFQNGLGNVGSRGGTSSGIGVGSNVVYGTNGQPLASVSTTDIQLGYQSATGGYNNDFDISRPQQLRAILQTQHDYISRASDAQIAMERIVPTLGWLDYCLPGPNPSWGTGLSDNFQALTGSLSQPPASGPTALQGFMSSIPILGGLFGGGNTSPPPVLAGEPVLYDKVTDTQRKLKPETFMIRQSAGAFNVPGNVSSIIPYLEASLLTIINELNASGFDPESLATAYASLESGTFQQADARAFAKSAYKEAGKLVGYNRNITEYTTQYNQNISNTEDALEQLTEIHRQTQDIVSRAKARYIAAQAAAGTPVDTTCINEAYVINTTPVVPVARVESDTPNSHVLQSIQSSQYFYSNL